MSLSFSTGVGPGEQSPVEVEFADGPHTIPGFIVRHLGGVAAINDEFRYQAGLVNYQDWYDAFWAEVQAAPLRNLQQMIISRRIKF